MGKRKKKDQRQAQLPSMTEDYDPARPNEYESCKREFKLRKQEEMQRRIYEAQHRSLSPDEAEPIDLPPQLAFASIPPPSVAVQPPPPPVAAYHPPPAAAIDLDVSGEEAYLRRMRLSREGPPQRAQPEPTEIQASVEEDEPSSVLLLLNMAIPEEVDESLTSEVTEECSKFGRVEDCVVRVMDNHYVPEDEAVRIFVKFSDIQSAIKGKQALHHRFFGGKRISATYFDEIDFRDGLLEV
ncbi:hypothetical protein BJ742DRAFT_769064 [Cladochytrium replicatum]|nr:hypothetical protein BJ742DRAFT_769064 [Cladochytrium replicatum]